MWNASLGWQRKLPHQPVHGWQSGHLPLRPGLPPWPRCSGDCSVLGGRELEQRGLDTQMSLSVFFLSSLFSSQWFCGSLVLTMAKGNYSYCETKREMSERLWCDAWYWLAKRVTFLTTYVVLYISITSQLQMDYILFSSHPLFQHRGNVVGAHDLPPAARKPGRVRLSGDAGVLHWLLSRRGPSDASLPRQRDLGGLRWPRLMQKYESVHTLRVSNSELNQQHDLTGSFKTSCNRNSSAAWCENCWPPCLRRLHSFAATFVFIVLW